MTKWVELLLNAFLSQIEKLESKPQSKIQAPNAKRQIKIGKTQGVKVTCTFSDGRQKGEH